MPKVPDEIDTLTRTKFIEYCKARKELDGSFGKVILDKFAKKEVNYEVQKQKQRERYDKLKDDEKFREGNRAKTLKCRAKKTAEKHIESDCADDVDDVDEDDNDVDSASRLNASDTPPPVKQRVHPFARVNNIF